MRIQKDYVRGKVVIQAKWWIPNERNSHDAIWLVE